jgi:hypothetical protein
MLEALLGVLIVLSACLSTYMVIRSLKITSTNLQEEQKEITLMTNENLNNVAGAIIGLSELLEEADQVIDEISRVPTVGDILQQAIQGFIVQKMTPMMPEGMASPMQEIINNKLSEVTHGTTQTAQKQEEITSEIQDGI